MKRKLLFTHEDVLPHEIGIGSLSFTHSHNRRSDLQQTREEATTNITLSANVSSCPPLVEGDATKLIQHNEKETDLKLVHNVEQLSIDDNSISTGVEELKGVASHSEDERNTVSDGRTFVVPVNSSATLQPTGHLPTVAVGNHGNCTSVFIDVVEWLSPLIVGRLEGKVR